MNKKVSTSNINSQQETTNPQQNIISIDVGIKNLA